MMSKNHNILLLCVLSGLLFACSDDPVGPSPTGTIIGTVVDGTTSEPLYEAMVFVTPDEIASGQSDPQGQFVLEGVSVGNQTLVVQRDRYQSAEVTVAVSENDTTYVDVELSRRPTTSGLVRGFVYSAYDGSPERNATVAWVVNGDSVAAAVTDNSGYYELPFVSVGNQHFGVLLPEFRPVLDSAEIEVSEAADLNFMAYNLGRFNRTSDKLMGYYSFRSNGDDDSYANRNLTALKNIQFVEDRLGIANDAAMFNGSAFAESSVGSGVYNNLPLTFSFWINTQATSRQALFSKFKASSQVGFNIGIDNGAVFVNYNSDTARMSISEVQGGLVNTGIWQHIVVVIDAQRGAELWVDGAQVGQQSWSDNIENITLSSGIPLQIGRPSVDDETMEHFTGMLDDIRVYGRALDASQVANLFSEQKDQ